MHDYLCYVSLGLLYIFVVNCPSFDFYVVSIRQEIG